MRKVCMSAVDNLGADVKNDLQAFAQDLVRIRSISGKEEKIMRFIAAWMEALGYDEVAIDSFGNVLGRVGNGEQYLPSTKRLLDSTLGIVRVSSV